MFPGLLLDPRNRGQELAWSLLREQVVPMNFWQYLGYLNEGGTLMLWTILVILLVLWLLGFIGHVGGGLIHLLLVVALVVFIINLVSGRRAV